MKKIIIMGLLLVSLFAVNAKAEDVANNTRMERFFKADKEECSRLRELYILESLENILRCNTDFNKAQREEKRRELEHSVDLKLITTKIDGRTLLQDSIIKNDSDKANFLVDIYLNRKAYFSVELAEISDQIYNQNLVLSLIDRVSLLDMLHSTPSQYAKNAEVKAYIEEKELEANSSALGRIKGFFDKADNVGKSIIKKIEGGN